MGHNQRIFCTFFHFKMGKIFGKCVLFDILKIYAVSSSTKALYMALITLMSSAKLNEYEYIRCENTENLKWGMWQAPTIHCSLAVNLAGKAIARCKCCLSRLLLLE